MITFLQGIVTGISMGAIYVTVSLGLTLILGVMNFKNFAHGEMVTVGAYTSFLLFFYLSISPFISLFLVVPILFLFGVFLQKLIVKPVMNRSFTTQLVLTFGLSIFIQSLLSFLFTSDLKGVPTQIPIASISLGGIAISTIKLINIAFAIALVAALALFLKKGRMGQFMVAVSENRQGAELVGINVNRVDQFAFGLGTALAGVAGAMLILTQAISPFVGFYFLLKAFIVLVLGGMGSIVGAIFGGFLLGIVESLTGLYLTANLIDLVGFIMLVVVLIFKPTGLFGKKL